MMDAKAYYDDDQLFVIGSLNFSTVEKIFNDSLPLLAQLKDLRINLSDVTSVNSAGITLLIEWVKYAKSIQKTISFSNVPEQLKSLAAISGFDAFLIA